MLFARPLKSWVCSRTWDYSISRNHTALCRRAELWLIVAEFFLWRYVCWSSVYSIRADKVCTRKRQDKHRAGGKLGKKLNWFFREDWTRINKKHGEPHTQRCQHEHRAAGEQHQHHRGPRDQHVPRHLYKHQNPLQWRHQGRQTISNCCNNSVESVTINCTSAAATLWIVTT